ncbi:hypothetical protein SDC9_158817 [bioreactor metagenome]|uniref:Nif11 domain-containing protein n=1 Tax=bioreactor metagenome TaxID=1076179 RepID=A0A645FG93_9ZZZZ|nr:hypothetical protein [Oscillospiraceae bacterium]
MKELPMELKQRINEAGKDGEWAAKLHNAESLEKFTELLKEKGIELPVEVICELKENSKINKTGKLDDNNLEGVAGGWTTSFNCQRKYNYYLCELTSCPHEHYDEIQCTKYCDWGYWSLH